MRRKPGLFMRSFQFKSPPHEKASVAMPRHG
jgi:hypothetical protein